MATTGAPYPILAFIGALSNDTCHLIAHYLTAAELRTLAATHPIFRRQFGSFGFRELSVVDGGSNTQSDLDDTICCPVLGHQCEFGNFVRQLTWKAAPWSVPTSLTPVPNNPGTAITQLETPSSRRFTALVSMLPTLTHLSIQAPTTVLYDLLDQLVRAGPPLLTDLTLTDTYCRSGARPLITAATRAKRPSVPIDSDGRVKLGLAEPSARFRHLTRLNVCCLYLSANQWAHLAHALPNLQRLQVTDGGGQNNPLGLVLDGVAFPDLRHLAWRGRCPLPNETVLALPQHYPHLRHLTLGPLRVVPHALLSVCHAGNLPKLRSLTLTGDQVASVCPPPPQPTYLASTVVSADNLAPPSPPPESQLHTLCLLHLPLSDTDLPQLAHRFTHLRHVTLRDCPANSSSYRQFLALASKLRTLTIHTRRVQLTPQMFPRSLASEYLQAIDINASGFCPDWLCHLQVQLQDLKSLSLGPHVRRVDRKRWATHFPQAQLTWQAR